MQAGGSHLGDGGAVVHLLVVEGNVLGSVPETNICCVNQAVHCLVSALIFICIDLVGLVGVHSLAFGLALVEEFIESFFKVVNLGGCCRVSILCVHCVWVFDWLIFGVICCPYHEPAGSEGENVPVGTQGDGDGGDDAENLEDYFICFHRGGGFDWLVNKAVVAERIVLPIVGHNDMIGHLCTKKGEGVDYSLGELLVFGRWVHFTAGVVVYKYNIFCEAVNYELGKYHNIDTALIDSTLRNLGPGDGLVVGVHQDEEKGFVQVEVVAVEFAGELGSGEGVFYLLDCWDCVGSLLASDFNAADGVGVLLFFHCGKF